jgi:hypothetical protein
MRLRLPTITVLIPAFGGSVATAAKTPALYDKRTNFNKRYPHGVGMPGAKDKREGKKKDDPVANFKRSASIYKTAMKWNDDLDRDDDRIACEKD